MIAAATKLEFTRHAVQVMAERAISVEWVERVLTEPAWRLPDPNDPMVERFFGRIAERDGRALRVVVNTSVAPWRVVSVFFDRSVRKEP